ncbi:calcium-activated chloride channel regulator 3A-1-like [Physella acuta]|uniref:calcium-activated chloride channel regulator 3A-1-like n=1 Tax=Physella acuta TaxID=109671 RepID=UPI0027DDCD4F|nr:calcium-activated chloride channel regulator 3A-1-like [Physella acuta]
MFLTAASATLFKATKNLLYFREFIIVVPETWTPKQFYENALDVELDRAQIIIDRSNPAYGDAPYVKQYAECGSPGLYIHLTPGYLLDDAVIQKWGNPDKTIVHEWAHLRWGLFDEYPIDAQDEAFYRFAGLWHPTRCTTDVEGSILNEYTSKQCEFDFFTGKPEKNCRFFPRMAANKAMASLMFMQYLDSMAEFCDDPTRSPKHLKHNVFAPNRQNRLCQYKSAWEVMRKHEDFVKTKKPLPSTSKTRPKFRYVQAHPRKRVLVLDTSGSMTGASLSVLKQAASNYILSCIETGSKLGIVQFNTNASTLSQLVEVKSEKDRFTLIDALPMQAEGKTSIGAGLKKGVEVLTKYGDAPGGTIILITDGKENEGPYLRDLRPALMKEGIVVHALAYGQRAEQSIAQLSQETGGKTFFYSGRNYSTALIDGLAATVAMENNIIPKANIPYSILSDAVSTRKGETLSGSFYIDSTIGTETSLTFSYSHYIVVRIEGPNENYTEENYKDSFKYDLSSKVLRVMIPGISHTGLWVYHVTTNATVSHVTVHIQSKPRGVKQEILQINSWIPQQGEVVFDPSQKFGIYAEVTRGKAPVLNAQVIASIERPQSSPTDILLLDNGVGADIIKGDGVYAASIMPRDLMGDGRYNIKVKVIGRKEETVVVTASGKGSRALEATTSGQQTQTETIPLENFQRVTTAGEFRLRGFPGSILTQEQLTDEIPPSRITDFSVVSFDYTNMTAVVQWTAVGSDMERGTASKYFIHYSKDFEELLLNRKSTELLKDAHILYGNLSQPRSSGSSEKLHLSLNTTGLGNNVTLFLSIYAVDSSGNEGGSSNIISLSPAYDTSVPRTPVPEIVSVQTYLAILLPLCLAIVAFFIFLVIFLVLKSKKIKSENIEQTEECTTHSVCSLDLEHMNYMFEGEYRKRLPEDIDSWSRGSI